MRFILLHWAASAYPTVMERQSETVIIAGGICTLLIDSFRGLDWG